MDGVIGRGAALGPRVPSALQVREAATMPTRTLGSFASRIMGRAAEETCAQANLCEKPVGGQTMTVAIALGVCIPLVSVVCVLLYLHRRSVQRQRREDMEDPHKSLDFGLGDNPGATAGKSKRKSFLNREKGDQARFQRQQMSMDMNLSSPYLLPPTMHSSRESLHSLARSLGNEREDPYRPVAAYAGSDAGSIRSVPRGPADRSSQYTRSGSRQGGPRGLGSPQSPQGEFKPPPRQNSLPKSNLSSPEPVYMKPEGSISEPASPPSTVPRNEEFVATPYPDGNDIGTAIPEPPAAAQHVMRKSITSPSQPSPADSGVGVGYENPFEGKHEREESDVLPQHTIAGLGLVNTPEAGKMSARTSTSSTDSSVLNSFPQRGPSAPATAPIIEEPSDYYDYPLGQDQSAPRDPKGLQPADEGRGRTMQRQSQLYEQQQGARKSGLGVPQGDTRRLSVGFRPLPPDEIMESEDPEYRANRIRSFYKEYFEDTKPSDMPPVPPMPAQHQNRGPQQNNNQRQGNNYYEDYSEHYEQDQPYFDPTTNSFVMPYAQPVARRAMTPPPTGQRFPGPRGPPRGPPRGFHGSMGGNNMRMPGPRGPPRPGSSVSNQRGPSRPGSAASSAWGRPRAGSAYSGSHYGGPKKPVPPPADLATLPTPAMLKDDSFALLNAMDFAPPENFQSRARGRSQSPMGERRPYKPVVPVHSPLVNAFEELPSLPSPHLLRKSTTFTALDFAPPRKFAESDNRSETGSIRSNKSGISAVQLGAIRNGAGRVSRLPGDTIFTQQAMQDKLKPSWNMRD